LHQEDLCQALGLPPTLKYEKEGGPSFATIAGLVRAQVRAPLIDLRRLIAWQVFNVVVGNADGHAKNLSLLHDGRTSVLAPLYDLVSTRHYGNLARDLAMRVGGQADLDEVRWHDWDTCAGELGVGARVMREIVTEVLDRCHVALPAWRREFRERHGAQSILQRLPQAIARRMARLRRDLA
jgi:serine/threonine-protein kinase HipA